MKSPSIILLFKKGAALGIVTGLIVTFFDSLYMFVKNMYVPPDFPIALIIANLLIWACIGCVSALVFRLVSSTKYYRSENAPFYWVYCFIIPFAYLYGLLGKIDIKNILPPQSDHYISFIWVTLLILFLLVFKRNIVVRKKTALSYLPEITAIVAIYHTGANLNHIPFIQKTLEFLIDAGQYTTEERWLQYYTYLTVISILTPAILVFPCYALTFLKKTKNKPRFNGIVILGVVIICWLGTAYLVKSSLQNKYSLPEPPQTQTVKDRKFPNIFLIVLDTVRADRLSVYGPCQTTPNLQKFAKDAVVYKNCIASSSWTGPSHASLFTGLYPAEHGYHHNTSKKAWSVKGNAFTNNITLADTLQRSGYQTYGIVSNYGVLHAGFGFDKGFHLYDAAKGVGSLIDLQHQPLLPFLSYFTHILPKYYLDYRTAGDLNRNIMATLENNSFEPFFIFCNYMEAHAPYSPPRPFNRQFSESRVPLISKLMSSFTTNDHDSVQNFSLSQYDGEIAYLDLYLGRLFGFLKKKGLYDSALIVITSDHGELFGEHNLYDHNNLLYEGVVKVPLLVKHPYQKQTGLDTTLITLSDVFATILDVSGVSAPENISGVSFGNNAGPAVAQFYQKSIGEHYAVYDDSYKFMYYEKNKHPELYNLKHDPEEKNNLYMSAASIAERLDRKLHEWKKQHPPRNTPDSTRTPISKEMKDNLKALGYIQ